MSQPRVWLITSTSAGLGRAVTELILGRWEIAVATARRPTALHDLFAKRPTDCLLVLKLDVTVFDDIADAFSRAKTVFVRMDVVVKNARHDLFGELEGIQEGVARGPLGVNVWGAMNVTRKALQFSRKEPGHEGRLLQTSSLSGFVTDPMHASYVASQFALEGMTESRAQEIDPAWNIKRPIKVVCDICWDA
ncbi:NAD(P)-binding protein [Trametes cingulata]|nr:NAD(P)-binding protein [Trametes cingulata]